MVVIRVAGALRMAFPHTGIVSHGISTATELGNLAMIHRLGPFLREAPRSKSRRASDRWRGCEELEARCLLAADPVITEFMADNHDAVVDGDGNPRAAVLDRRQQY